MFLHKLYSKSEQTQKLTRTTITRADIIHSQREIEVLFSTLKNSPFPQARSIKLHIRALVLTPYLIPCHRCENPQAFVIWSHNITTSARIYVVRGSAICSKSRKIVPYHRYLRFPAPIMAPDVTPCCGGIFPRIESTLGVQIRGPDKYSIQGGSLILFFSPTEATLRVETRDGKNGNRNPLRYVFHLHHLFLWLNIMAIFIYCCLLFIYTTF